MTDEHCLVLDKHGYILCHKLAAGAHSTCYLVKKKNHSTLPLVCKISNQFQEEEKQSKFKICQNEISIMGRLNHPNIIHLFDHFTEQGRIYMILEYCEHGSIQKAIITDSKMIKENINNLTLQICEGLEYCHQNGIAHVDLKPDNILLSSDNTIKLADFGLSDFNPSEEKRSEVKGTKIYMAPEVLKGELYDPFRADIWSLGITLFQMVSGGYITQVENMMAMWNSIYVECAEYGNIGTIIRMCMTPSPENRPTIQQIKQRLESKEKPSEMKELLYSISKRGRSRTNAVAPRQARTLIIPKVKKRLTPIVIY